MIITAFAHLANSSEWQWYDVMTFITDISVSGDLSQCQLGSRWRSWLSDLFVASIQMTEFLHNNDDCHSSRDMRHPTVGIIVYSKIVWSHLAWQPCMFGLYTQHIRGVEWNHFVGCISVYAAWEPRDAWLVHCGSEYLSITCRAMLGSSTCGPGCESQHGDEMVGRWQSGPHTPPCCIKRQPYLDHLAKSCRPHDEANIAWCSLLVLLKICFLIRFYVK